MDTNFAVRKAGGQQALAHILGISRQAVNQWGPRLPELQRYRLKELRPGWWREYLRTQQRAA